MIPILATLRQERRMKIIEMLESEELMAGNSSSDTVYPYTASFEEARLTPCMVLHTSGSTGTPKAIAVKQGWFCVIVSAMWSISILFWEGPLSSTRVDVFPLV